MLYDFTSVTPESVTQVVDEAIAEAERLVAGVVGYDGPRGWDNSLAPLEAMAAVLAVASGRGPFMARVHAGDEVRAAASIAEERLNKWAVDLAFRRDLYEALKAYSTTDDAAALPPERRRLLDFWMRDFRRAGHELTEAERDEVQRLRARMVELQVAFAKNVDEFQDHIEVTGDDLTGLPKSYIDSLRPGDADGTYRVTMEYPDYVPFMEQSPRRDLRRQLEFKFRNRAVAENRALIEEAVALRRQIAAKLGYPTWAHFGLEVKMAKDPKAVEQFYQELVPGLTRKAEGELVVLRELLDELEPGAELRSWDLAYLDTQQRKRDYGIDQNEIAEYFPLEQVIDGMFEITGEVFGLEYRTVEDAPVWHPDVTLYEIVAAGSGDVIARFYADLFPRDGKFGHAAAFDLVKGQRNEDGSYVQPASAMVANFTKPSKEQPSLLKHDEVVTLFHEFGHILHMSLTQAELVRFSGADTEWDFVEAPSQIMEHWCWQAPVLQRFARHYESGEPIPDATIGRLVAARNLNVGLLNLRQVYYGTLDMALHAIDHEVDLAEADRTAYRVTLFPFHEDTFMLASFGHLMGGYDAGYYGYLWSKVFGDDMFSIFEDEGVTSPDVGRRYREQILAPGGSVDASDLLRNFLGREPSNEAFLRHMGLNG